MGAFCKCFDSGRLSSRATAGDSDPARSRAEPAVRNSACGSSTAAGKPLTAGRELGVDCGVVRLSAACALLLVTSIAVAREPETADPRATEANITRATASFLARSQLAHHPLDAQLAGKLLERYMDALDGTRSLFLRSDLTRLGLDEQGSLRDTLADRTRADGDTQAARVLFSCY